MSVQEITKYTDNKFLNLYKTKITNDKTGDTYPYYIASRRNIETLACITKNHNKADAVLVIPMYENNDVVLIKQYRPSIDDYIYEFPAGLVDSGETVSKAAKRELFEEIGLECIAVEKILGPSYTSVGMSDETCAVYMAHVKGDITNKYNEGHEDIEPIVLKLSDAIKFINEKRVSIKTALILRSLYHEAELLRLKYAGGI